MSTPLINQSSEKTTTKPITKLPVSAENFWNKILEAIQSDHFEQADMIRETLTIDTKLNKCYYSISNYQEEIEKLLNDSSDLRRIEKTEKFISILHQHDDYGSWKYYYKFWEAVCAFAKTTTKKLSSYLLKLSMSPLETISMLTTTIHLERQFLII